MSLSDLVAVIYKVVQDAVCPLINSSGMNYSILMSFLTIHLVQFVIINHRRCYRIIECLTLKYL